MRISDWSSDVCSSDLCEALAPLARAQRPVLVSIAAGITSAQISRWLGGGEGAQAPAIVRCMPNTPAMLGDRKSDGWGKSVSVSVDIGGGRIITTTQTTAPNIHSRTQFTTQNQL